MPTPLLRGEGSLRPWQALQVEDDPEDARLVNRCLMPTLPPGSEIDHVGSLDEALEHLRTTDYDAVLLDLSLPDSHGLETLRDVLSQADSPPVLVLSGNEDPQTAQHAIQNGASDFVLKSRLSGASLHDRLRKLVHPNTASAAQLSQDLTLSDAAALVTQRFSVTLPAVVVPIDDDGGPGLELASTTLEVSNNELTLLAEFASEPLPDLAMVGVETGSHGFSYAAFQWLEQTSEETGLRLVGRLLSRATDPFHESKLLPKLNPRSHRFAPKLSEDILRQWALRGVLEWRPIDRVKSCPQCMGLATFRDGCPRCGNAYTKTMQLIHHFPCAHVAPVSEYETDGLVCPKCRDRDLVVGADFEYLDGPCCCSDCNWTDAQPALLGECLSCGLRFNGTKAHEIDVIQFYVPRLNLADLVESQR